MTTPYASTWREYHRLGWPSMLPLPAGAKWPPPTGYTGHDGRIPSFADMTDWADNRHGAGNIALRLPDDVIGIDVDNYDSKRGADTLAEAERRWGPLPPAPRSTSRDDGISGIRLYRIPAGTVLQGDIRFTEQGIGDIEVVQFHHRYVVCAPSVHPEGGTYRWLDAGGQEQAPPALESLDALPSGWLDALRDDTPAARGELGAEVTVDVRAALTAGEPSERVSQWLTAALEAIRNPVSSRYDATRDSSLTLLRFGKQGDSGVAAALVTLRQAYVAAVAAKRGDGSARMGTRVAEGEFARFVRGAGKPLAAPDTSGFAAQQRDMDLLTGGRGEARCSLHLAAAPTVGATALHIVPDPDKADAEPPVDEHEASVQKRLGALRIDREARQRLDDENRPAIEYPPVRGLDDLLAEPDADTAYRIEGLAPAEARIMLAAQFKAGKTTIVSNVTRSLVDGDAFLGHFAVHTPAQRLVLVDNELSQHTLRKWLREQGIRNTSAVVDVVALRGKVATFDLLDDRCRAAWARRFRDLGADYLILDCLRPVLDALGLDENHDAGKFLVAFDAMLAEAGISDALLVQHMGHANERARGDSRLQDWPDATWRLVRESDDPASPRYFSAYGRDVDVAEGLLEYDARTRGLRLLGQSRKVAAAEATARDDLGAVVAVLVQDTIDGGDGLSQAAVIDAARSRFDIGRPRTVKALKAGEHDGLITCRDGARRAQIYALANPCSECAQPVSAPGRTTHYECERAS